MCHNVYSTDPDEVHLYWYPMKTIREFAIEDEHGEYVCDEDGNTLMEKLEVTFPSTYCIDCEKRRTSEARRLRNEIKKLPPTERAVAEANQLGGDCDGCGERKRRGKREYVEHQGRGYALCELCHRCCDVVEWDHQHAKAAWKFLFDHVQYEKKLNAKWLENHTRPRTYHSTFPRESGKGSPWRHATPEDVDDLPLVHYQCKWMEKAWRHVYRFPFRVASEIAATGVIRQEIDVPAEVAVPE